MKNFLYSYPLTEEAAKVLENQGVAAIKRYFRNLRKYCPNRPLNYLEEILRLQTASKKEISAIVRI